MPISILCNFVKVFEPVMFKNIYNDVNQHIYPNQHGFVENRSTITNLACYAQYLAKSLDDRSQVDAMYTDFSKWFD